ncbi:MAG: DUF4382 domain-containing protein [Candidatus Bathyarchaeota archaeon]|jgi:hypothetical protein
MGEDMRHASIYGIAGILVAVLIIAGVVSSGLQFPSLRLPSFVSDKGTLIVEIMDGPVDLKHLNLTIDKLMIQNATEGWQNLTLIGGEPVYFDLLALENVTMTLSETEIPAGNYTMIKMHVLTANATDAEGETIHIRKVPSEWIKVLLKPHLEMKSGGSVKVTIDLEPELAKIVISHSLNLKPVLKAMISN